MKLSKERKQHFKKMLAEVDKFVKSGKKLDNVDVIETPFGSLSVLRYECIEEKKFKIEFIEE